MNKNSYIIRELYSKSIEKLLNYYFIDAIINLFFDNRINMMENIAFVLFLNSSMLNIS